MRSSRCAAFRAGCSLRANWTTALIAFLKCHGDHPKQEPAEQGRLTIAGYVHRVKKLAAETGESHSWPAGPRGRLVIRW